MVGWEGGFGCGVLGFWGMKQKYEIKIEVNSWVKKKQSKKLKRGLFFDDDGEIMKLSVRFFVLCCIGGG